jgi:uncharacterized protein (TIGR00730 family)
MKAVCIYCGSSLGAQPRYAQVAREAGTVLAQRGITLVYGGGAVGLMGVLADAALAAGGRVVGIIPQLLMDKEVGHRGLTELHVVPDMHTRKRMMAERADGFIALPGGLGTFEELFEIWTWRQLGYHDKPIGLLNEGGYYDALRALLHGTVNEGFVRAQQLDYVRFGARFEPLLDAMAADYARSSHAPARLDAA